MGQMPRQVMPGDVITREARRAGRNVLLDGDRLVSTVMGIVVQDGDEIGVRALAGRYVPSIDDLVVAKVIAHTSMSWELDINSYYVGFLPATDVFGRDYAAHADELASRLELGDMVAARVANFDRTRDPLLTIDDRDLGKIDSGELLTMAPGRVSALIGRQGEMVREIEHATGAAFTIGQNGWVVISCEDHDGLLRAKKAVAIIEQESYTQGLLDRVRSAVRKGHG